MGHALGQSPGYARRCHQPVHRHLDWRDPKYYECWGREEALWKAGYFNDDMNSIDLYPGIDLFGAGKAAMTAIVTPLAASQAKMLGSSEKIGAMVFPVFGAGKMAGKPIADCQGFGISTQSENKEVAAEFLRFMHKPEYVTSLWEASQVLPMDKSFDGNAIEDPLLKQIWSRLGQWGGRPLHLRPDAGAVLDRCHVRQLAEDHRW